MTNDAYSDLKGVVSNVLQVPGLQSSYKSRQRPNPEPTEESSNWRVTGRTPIFPLVLCLDTLTRFRSQS